MNNHYIKYGYKLIFLSLYYGLARHLPNSMFPVLGKSFKWFRAFCCRRIFKSMGRNVNVEHGVLFGSGFNIEIGDNSGIGIHCTVPSTIKIGRDVMMAPQVFILAQNHNVDRTDVAMRGQGFIFKYTTIEDDVWIGRQSLFTPGRTVRHGTVIAAGTVLCKDFPEFSMVGGNPSRLIKSRLTIK